MSSSPARIDFARPGGQWQIESVPGSNDYYRWDANCAKLVNGDLGGTWSPTSPIVIGGTGGLASTGSNFVGGAATRSGGRIIIAASANDTPILAPSRTRTVTVPLIGGSLNPEDFGTPTPFVWSFDDQYGWGIRSVGAGAYGILEIPGRYMHIGAQIRQAKIVYVVTQRPTATPADPMIFGFMGAAATGTNVQFGNPSIFSGYPSFALGNLIGFPISSPVATALGTYWTPSTTALQTGLYYKITTLGSPATTSVEPTWPTTIGATTTPDSHGNVWTCTGHDGIAFPGLGTPLAYYNNGQPQALTFDFDGAGSGPYSTIIVENVRYALRIESTDPTILITGVQLTFDSIASMAFE